MARLAPDGARRVVPGRWAASCSFELLGTAFRVWASSIALAAAIERLLKPSLRSHDDVPHAQELFLEQLDDGSYRLGRDGRLLTSSRSWSAVADVLLGELNRVALDQFDGLAVHAGVVAWTDRVIAFPGRSGLGKSTMVAACIAAGFVYVSDEALCLELSSCSVVSYPKPLRLAPNTCPDSRSPAATPVGREVNVAPGDIGATVASGRLTLAHVVSIVRRPGPTRLDEVHASQAAAWLLRFSFNHYKRPERSFGVVAGLAPGLRAWRLFYEDAVDATPVLVERVSGN